MMHERLKERNLAILAFYCEKNTIDVVAEKFGLTPQRIHVILTKLGIKSKHRKQSMKPFKPKPTNQERFWANIDVLEDTNSCWFWRNQNGKKKYGVFSYKGEFWKAHRLAWFFTYGKKPTKWILHDCGNCFCCNPNHLKEGNAKENAADRERHYKEKGISPKRGRSKLTIEQVREIKHFINTKTLSQILIARQYNISPSLVCNIGKGKIWQNV